LRESGNCRPHPIFGPVVMRLFRLIEVGQTMARLQRALEAAGIILIDQDGPNSPGARIKKPLPYVLRAGSASSGVLQSPIGQISLLPKPLPTTPKIIEPGPLSRPRRATAQADAPLNKRSAHSAGRQPPPMWWTHRRQAGLETMCAGTAIRWDQIPLLSGFSWANFPQCD
jgi:hypothetical protein